MGGEGFLECGSKFRRPNGNYTGLGSEDNETDSDEPFYSKRAWTGKTRVMGRWML